MQTSEHVGRRQDHAVMWGNENASAVWLAYPLREIPFSTFTLEVEVAADTADDRWPNLGIAFNRPDQILLEQPAKTVDWHYLAFGGMATNTGEGLLYFVFTNDYWNPVTERDVNLKIRNIIFRAEIDTLTVSSDSVRVRWEANTESDLAGYRIHYGGARRAYVKHIDVRSATSIVFKLDDDGTYFLAVTAYDSAGNESYYSDEVLFRRHRANDLLEPPSFNSSCDINDDHIVDARDESAFRASFGSRRGNARYNPRADFNQDGKVNHIDLAESGKLCQEAWR